MDESKRMYIFDENEIIDLIYENRPFFINDKGYLVGAFYIYEIGSGAPGTFVFETILYFSDFVKN